MSQATVYTLYLLFALGGIALVCLMPGGDRRRRTLGTLLGVSAVIGLVVLLAVRRHSADSPRTLFYVFSVIALVAGARVITHPKPRLQCDLFRARGGGDRRLVGTSVG